MNFYETFIFCTVVLLFTEEKFEFTNKMTKAQ